MLLSMSGGFPHETAKKMNKPNSNKLERL
jgi:hypothetical protein